MLYKALAGDPPTLENETICTINDPPTDLPKDTYVTMSAIIKEGEKQFKSFTHERLLY